ncbi:MAG TPA: SDR family NAD(P)-dependent oxidoreductase, partial [Sedimentisphaerales bacterium]|nr:SDR family NAD(P)-dependent oxidoreductase [Sedimentisphaerales bacterium]
MRHGYEFPGVLQGLAVLLRDCANAWRLPPVRLCLRVADVLFLLGGRCGALIALDQRRTEGIAGTLAGAGPVDILVNNAGITRDNLFMRLKDEDWDSVLAVNLTAAFRLSRAAVKSMMRRRYGRIVAIGSVVGTTGNPGQGNYAAAKAGLIGMSKALAAEVASRNITV